MALVVKDRVKESASNPGTGTVTLSGAVAGFRSFGDIGSGNTTYYVIFDVANSLFEVGEGTYTDNTGGGGNRELARNEVLQNSSGNTSKINFTGSVEVFVALPASKSVHKNNTDNLELTGDFTITSGSATDQIVMKNTNTGTDAAPDLVLWRDSASPANADSLGRIDFRGEDDGSTARNYTSIESKIVNVAASTPTGAIHFKTLNASTTEADVLVLSGNTSTFSGNVDVSGDVSVTSGTNARLSINDAIGEVGSGNLALQVGNSAQNALKPMGFRAEKFIFADGNLGIGTTSPASLLTINGDGTTVRLDGSGNTTRTIFFRSTTTSNPAQIYADGSLRLRTEDASTAIIFNTNSSGTNNEAMRIDGSQNLMVGRTSLGISNTGHTLAAAGYVEFTRDGAAALNVGRNSSFGETAVFWKDGTQQGSIASESGYLKVIGGNGSSVGSGLLFTNTVIAPRSHTGASTNGTIDLGYNTERFKDLHLSNVGYAGASFRAPIFYDSDNTSYYVDGASNSNFYQVRAQNGGIIAGTLSQPTSMGQIAIYSGANPYMSWHNGATNARHGYIQHISDHDRFYFGEVSYTESAGSFRAPLFYDTNNTSKYINPNGESQITAMSIDGGTSNNSNDATLFVSATNNNDWGISIDKYRGSATEYGMRLDVGTSANYAFLVRGNDVEKFRIAGNGTTYIQNNLYASAFYDVDNSSYYLNPSSTSNLYTVIAPNYVQTPIVYDHNNSSYYVDPSSTSQLYNVTVNNQLYLNTNTTLSSAGTVGTAGQVLTSNGNSRPTWQDASGSKWEHVTTLTGSDPSTNTVSVYIYYGFNPGDRLRFIFRGLSFMYSDYLCARFSTQSQQNPSSWEYCINTYWKLNQDTSNWSHVHQTGQDYPRLTYDSWFRRNSQQGISGYMDYYQENTTIATGSSTLFDGPRYHGHFFTGPYGKQYYFGGGILTTSNIRHIRFRTYNAYIMYGDIVVLKLVN